MQSVFLHNVSFICLHCGVVGIMHGLWWGVVCVVCTHFVVCRVTIGCTLPSKKGNKRCEVDTISNNRNRPADKSSRSLSETSSPNTLVPAAKTHNTHTHTLIELGGCTAQAKSKWAGRIITNICLLLLPRRHGVGWQRVEVAKARLRRLLLLVEGLVVGPSEARTPTISPLFSPLLKSMEAEDFGFLVISSSLIKLQQKCLSFCCTRKRLPAQGMILIFKVEQKQTKKKKNM